MQSHAAASAFAEASEGILLRIREGRQSREARGAKQDGGRGGIRTHGGREPTAVFKTAAFNHSATRPAPPSSRRRRPGSSGGA